MIKNSDHAPLFGRQSLFQLIYSFVRVYRCRSSSSSALSYTAQLSPKQITCSRGKNSGGMLLAGSFTDLQPRTTCQRIVLPPVTWRHAHNPIDYGRSLLETQATLSYAHLRGKANLKRLLSPTVAEYEKVPCGAAMIDIHHP